MKTLLEGILEEYERDEGLAFDDRKLYESSDTASENLEWEDDVVSTEDLCPLGLDCQFRGRPDPAEVESPPWRYICSIEALPRGRDSVILGSGTLIGPTRVLTAAHVVSAPRTCALPDPDRIRVTPGRAGSLSPFGQSRAANIIRNPAFDCLVDDICSDRDFAVIELKDPLGKKAGFWGQRPRPRFDSRGSKLGSIGGWRPGRYRVNYSGYPVTLNGVQLGCYAQTLPGAPTPTILDFNGCCLKGHSGSPVWVTRDRSLGGRWLFGIVVSSEPPECCGVLLTPRNRDFWNMVQRHAGR